MTQYKLIRDPLFPNSGGYVVDGLDIQLSDLPLAPVYALNEQNKSGIMGTDTYFWGGNASNKTLRNNSIACLGINGTDFHFSVGGVKCRVAQNTEILLKTETSNLSAGTYWLYAELQAINDNRATGTPGTEDYVFENRTLFLKVISTTASGYSVLTWYNNMYSDQSTKTTKVPIMQFVVNSNGDVTSFKTEPIRVSENLANDPFYTIQPTTTSIRYNVDKATNAAIMTLPDFVATIGTDGVIRNQQTYPDRPIDNNPVGRVYEKEISLNVNTFLTPASGLAPLDYVAAAIFVAGGQTENNVVWCNLQYTYGMVTCMAVQNGNTGSSTTWTSWQISLTPDTTNPRNWRNYMQLRKGYNFTLNNNAIHAYSKDHQTSSNGVSEMTTTIYRQAGDTTIQDTAWRPTVIVVEQGPCVNGTTSSNMSVSTTYVSAMFDLPGFRASAGGSWR